MSELREALKAAAVALKGGDLPFALAGGYGLWARGGPEPEHDVDFVVAEADREQATRLLRDGGLEVVEPAEDWLFKAYAGEAMVDVLFRINGVTVTREQLEGADLLEVESVRMPVLSATAMLTAKMNALDERSCDLTGVLPAARAVREQVDWDAVARDVQGNDFAEVTLLLLGRLGVVGSLPRTLDR